MKSRLFLTISSLLTLLTLTACAGNQVIEQESYPLAKCLVTEYEIVTNADLAQAYMIARSELRECAGQTDAAIEYNSRHY